MATILATTDKNVEGTSEAKPACDPRLAEPPRWQGSLRNAIRSTKELCQRLQIPEPASSLSEDFPVIAPEEYVNRMRVGDPTDPLLRQVLPVAEESLTELQLAGVADPVGDLAASREHGLIQKYHGRILVIASGSCAVNCRYCFRRHYPYQDAPKGHLALRQAIEALASDPSLQEVILSGGDPLMLADQTLAEFSLQLNKIPHVTRLRIHTRLPVVIPTRICDSLTKWVQQSSKAVYFVLHFNHANEIDPSVASALERLRGAGACLLNQAVLLKDINDSFEAQRDLCEGLVNHNVIPYYLHQLDPVRGAMHFEADQAQGREIVRQLRETLPGYAVPTFVREIPGKPSKTPL